MYQSQSIPQFRRITFNTEKNQRMSPFPSVLTFRKGSMSTLLRECSYYATWMTSAENKHTLSQYRANGQTAYRRIFDFPCLLCAFIFFFFYLPDVMPEVGEACCLILFYNAVLLFHKKGPVLAKRKNPHNTVRQKTTFYQWNIIQGNSIFHGH